jgi:hypothetical protein
MYHHAEDLPEKMRGVRVLLGITVCMVHPVEDRISSRIQIRGSLCDPCIEIPEFLHGGTHGEHLVRRIAMQEECLTEKRQVPVEDDEK